MTIKKRGRDNSEKDPFSAASAVGLYLEEQNANGILVRVRFCVPSSHRGPGGLGPVCSPFLLLVWEEMEEAHFINRGVTQRVEQALTAVDGAHHLKKTLSYPVTSGDSLYCSRTSRLQSEIKVTFPGYCTDTKKTVPVLKGLEYWHMK